MSLISTYSSASYRGFKTNDIELWNAEPYANITGSDTIANDFFGYASKISGDGNYLIVGAYQKNANVGAAYVFNKTGNTWSQQQKLTLTGTLKFGISVDINYDGTKLVVGSNTGGYIFSRTSNTWTNTSNLAGGYSVAISDNGNIIVGGDPSYNSNIGRIYTSINGVIDQFDAPNPYLVSQFNTGYSVDISGDGSTILAGMPGYTSSGINYGGVLIYKITNSVVQFNSFTSTFYGGYSCGINVSANNNGNTFAISSFHGTNPDRITVFDRASANNWSIEALLTIPRVANSTFVGSQIFSSSDGNTFMGMSLTRNGISNGIYLFERSDSSIIENNSFYGKGAQIMSFSMNDTKTQIATGIYQSNRVYIYASK